MYFYFLRYYNCFVFIENIQNKIKIFIRINFLFLLKIFYVLIYLYFLYLFSELIVDGYLVSFLIKGSLITIYCSLY